MCRLYSSGAHEATCVHARVYPLLRRLVCARMGRVLPSSFAVPDCTAQDVAHPPPPHEAKRALMVRRLVLMDATRQRRLQALWADPDPVHFERRRPLAGISW